MWSELELKNKHLWLAWLLLAVYLSPLFILGENAHIRVHDNLDSNIAWYKVLRESGLLFGPVDSTVPQIINGLPRDTFGTEFSGIEWLHHLFPSMMAFALSQAITRCFAFMGMYLLLKKHFLKEPEVWPISVWVSFAFAITPFWPSGMLSTLGMPLALWAFLNIRNGDSTPKNWLTLILLPLYSSFVLGFFFFLASMGIFWLYDALIRKKRNWVFLGGIALMTAVYLLVEYRLVYSLLFPQEPTSRDEFVSSNLGFWHAVRLTFENYLLGHTHVMTLHTAVILPVLFIVMWKIWKSGIKTEKTFIWLFMINIILSVWYAFWFYKGWQPIKDKVSLLNTFNFARLHFLRPLIIYLLFGLGCRFLWKMGFGWKKAVKWALVLQILILFGANPEIDYRVIGKPSFKEFYAEKQFEQIKEYIGKPQSSYRVASIGLHPSIAQYNGFYTLDTYNNYYPLSYKKKFRKIIAPELEKNRTLRTYFDDWGNRCYIFVDELGKNYDFTKNSHKKIRHLDLNTDAFKRLGGDYFFSAVPIENAQENRLKFLKAFSEKDSAWKIYLYKVQTKQEGL
ncbi:DUF6044 family protein [Fictibacillus enclensis]|uniref:DUF6044 family protein n=1 Tax=Fictibacillus enclensis TaxID=1017270 RepID=UPI0024BFF8C0|nr:DUF6044 family protein [Fictibacillus enclensis]WHY70572.1 DUF6044 family protein [Fictibacillus enclensis]